MYTRSNLDLLQGGAIAHVPAISPLEVANSLVVAERRKIIQPADSVRFFEALQAFEIFVDGVSMSRAFSVVASHARRYQRSAYDAAYLELAERRSLPIATRDEPMRQAALAMGLNIVNHVASTD